MPKLVKVEGGWPPPLFPEWGLVVCTLTVPVHWCIGYATGTGAMHTPAELPVRWRTEFATGTGAMHHPASWCALSLTLAAYRKGASEHGTTLPGAPVKRRALWPLPPLMPRPAASACCGTFALGTAARHQGPAV